MNRKAVLIVDDEADIRELLVLTLSRMGVDADTASSFKEAQEALSMLEMMGQSFTDELAAVADSSIE